MREERTCGMDVGEEFACLWYDDEDLESSTSVEQFRCERSCCEFLASVVCLPTDRVVAMRKIGVLNDGMQFCLLKRNHVDYLRKYFTQLPGSYVTLDASRPWIIYWILHALYLLRAEPYELYSRIITQMRHMQNMTGGFGAGPMQISHGAPTYAAVLALCTLGSEEALQVINRPAMYNYYMNMKHSCGGFTMHEDGEVDSRSTYTVIAIASLLNLLTPELTAGVAEYLLSCQSYEGGFGGEPGNEAHGGYNFCALAALYILKQV